MWLNFIFIIVSSLLWKNEYQLLSRVMVLTGDCGYRLHQLIAGLTVQVGLVWGSAIIWRCFTFIRGTVWNDDTMSKALEKFSRFIIMTICWWMPVSCCVYNVQELLSSLDDVADDKFGRKVLLYLLQRRDTLHFHPSVVSILSCGDSNKHRLTTASLSSLCHHCHHCVINFLFFNVCIISTSHTLPPLLLSHHLVGV